MSDKIKATFELGYDSYVENLETKEKAVVYLGADLRSTSAMR